MSDGEGQVESVVLRQHTLPLGATGAAQISDSCGGSKAQSEKITDRQETTKSDTLMPEAHSH